MNGCVYIAGVIEYVDVNEENNCLVALCEEDITPEHTHMEIDPLTILGVVAGWSWSHIYTYIHTYIHAHTPIPYSFHLIQVTKPFNTRVYNCW